MINGRRRRIVIDTRSFWARPPWIDHQAKVLGLTLDILLVAHLEVKEEREVDMSDWTSSSVYI